MTPSTKQSAALARATCSARLELVGSGICDLCGETVDELVAIYAAPVAGLCGCKKCMAGSWPDCELDELRPYGSDETSGLASPNDKTSHAQNETPSEAQSAALARAPGWAIFTMNKRQLLDRYDEDCVEAAADLWATLRETPTHMQHLIICEALKEYSCEHDKRLTSDQWAQHYREACIKISEQHDEIERLTGLLPNAGCELDELRPYGSAETSGIVSPNDKLTQDARP